MKQYHTAAIVLAVIVALVILNAVCLRRVTDDLIAMLEALPEIPDPAKTPQAVAALREELERHMTMISLSVNYNTLDRALEALYSLEAYARAGDAAQYEATRAALRDLFDDLGRLERLRAENIL